MSDDLILAIAFFGCLVAAAVLAYGIVRLDIRLVLAGGVATGAIWLGWGWLNEDEWTTYRLIDLKFRAVDSVTGEAVQGVTVSTTAAAEHKQREVYRLPCTMAANKIFKVSIIAELHLDGSLLDRLRGPTEHTKLVDQELHFDAPGHRSLQRTLRQLLPAGWPTVPLPATPLELRLEPE